MRTAIRLISPCPDPGFRLGDLEPSRHCPTCDRVVVNLSALAPEDADRAVAAGHGMCAQFRRGLDGAVLHLAGAALVGLAGCAPTHEPMTNLHDGSCRSDVHVVRVEAAAGNVEVVVVDDSGLSIPGALVTARGPGGWVLQMSTDDEGKATFQRVPAGHLEWTIEMLGFAAIRVAVTLDGGATRISAALRGGSVTVGGIGVMPLLTDEASMTTTFNTDSLSRLPRLSHSTGRPVPGR